MVSNRLRSLLLRQRPIPVFATPDPLVALSDDFSSGDTDMATRGWVRVDDTTTPAGDGRIINTACVIGTGYEQRVDAGGGLGSLHFNANRGTQWAKIIDADVVAMEIHLDVTNDANTGNPPLDSFRLVGAIAHSDHALGTVDHEACLFGVASTGPRAYYADTINGASNPFGGTMPGYGNSVTLTYWTGWLRLMRNGQRWVMQYKENEEDAWITLHDATRDPGDAMDSELYWGFGTSSNQATHDVRGLIHEVRFYTPTAGDFP